MIGYWSSFLLIGKGVKVGIRDIRHSMLDQTLDKVEKDYKDCMSYDPLNPAEITPMGKSSWKWSAKRHRGGGEWKSICITYVYTELHRE